MPHDPQQVESVLSRLIGLPLSATRRAADMQSFHFGAELTGLSRKGERVTFGELAVHVQCAWQISGPEGIIVGSGDLHAKSSTANNVPDKEWDWAKPGSSLRDELLSQLMARPHVVAACTADARGGFSVAFTDGYQLNVFADVSGESECWRMLFNGEEREHFVVLGSGIEV